MRFINWLDSIRFRFLDPTMWFKRNKRLGSRLWRNGTQADARIVGIKVSRLGGTEDSGSSLRWEFALEVVADVTGRSVRAAASSCCHIPTGSGSVRRSRSAATIGAGLSSTGPPRWRAGA